MELSKNAVSRTPSGDIGKRIYKDMGNGLYCIETPYVYINGNRSYDKSGMTEGNPDILELKKVREMGFEVEPPYSESGTKNVSSAAQISLTIGNSTAGAGYIRLGVDTNSYRFISATNATNQSVVDSVAGSFGANTIKAISDMAMFGRYLKIDRINIVADDEAFYTNEMTLVRTHFNGTVSEESRYFPKASPKDQSPHIRDVYFGVNGNGEQGNNGEVYLCGDNSLKIVVGAGRSAEMQIYCEWANKV